MRFTELYAARLIFHVPFRLPTLRRIRAFVCARLPDGEALCPPYGLEDHERGNVESLSLKYLSCIQLIIEGLLGQWSTFFGIFSCPNRTLF